jgi:hypothetical protein
VEEDAVPAGKRVCIWTVGLLISSTVWAEDGEGEKAPGNAAQGFGLGVDLTYASTYMAHGFNIGEDDKPSLQPSVSLNLPLPGLQLAYWGAIPPDENCDSLDEHDYLVKFNRTWFASECWAFNLHHYVDYWIYPHLSVLEDKNGEPISASHKDGLKFMTGVSFPKLIPIGSTTIVPSYNVYYWTPVQEDLFEPGAVHELGLSGGWPMPESLGLAKGQTLDASTTINYNDGTFGVNAGWSHATAGLSSTFPLGAIRITPAVNYQWSFEKTVDPEDEFWAALTLSWSL